MHTLNCNLRKPLRWLWLIMMLRLGMPWMNTLLSNSKDVLDAIYAYELKLNYLTEKHDFVAAVNMLLDVLKKLGHTIKRDPSQVAIMTELARTLWTLKNKKIKDLVDLPLMTDPSAYAFLKLTVKGATSIFWNSTGYTSHRFLSSSTVFRCSRQLRVFSFRLYIFWVCHQRIYGPT